jgi:hypothetical protein
MSPYVIPVILCEVAETDFVLIVFTYKLALEPSHHPLEVLVLT